MRRNLYRRQRQLPTVQTVDQAGVIARLIAQRPRVVVLAVRPPLYAPLDERFLRLELGAVEVDLAGRVGAALRPQGFSMLFWRDHGGNDPRIHQALRQVCAGVSTHTAAAELPLVGDCSFLYSCRLADGGVPDLPALLAPAAVQGAVVVAVPGILEGGVLTFIDCVDPWPRSTYLMVGSQQSVGGAVVVDHPGAGAPISVVPASIPPRADRAAKELAARRERYLATEGKPPTGS